MSISEDGTLSDSTLSRPISRAHHPSYDAATRRDVHEYMRDRGAELRPAYAALVIMSYLQRVLGCDAVCGADVRALYPPRESRIAGSLHNAHDILRRAAVRRLVEPLGDGWYRLTSLGSAVVDALPNDDQVALLRGCRTVTSAVGRRRLALGDAF